MMATDGHTEDINIFLSSLGHCFEEADKALKDECNSVPLDYTESGLEDHLQIVKLLVLKSLVFVISADFAPGIQDRI